MNYEEMKAAVRKWRENCLPECNGPNDSYCKDIKSISCNELDSICDELNAEWEAKDSSFRIGWSMGEFHPAVKRQRELPL